MVVDVKRWRDGGNGDIIITHFIAIALYLPERGYAAELKLKCVVPEFLEGEIRFKYYI